MSETSPSGRPLTVNEAIALADRAADRGDHAEARRLYSLVLAQFPRSGPARDGIRALAWRVPRRSLGKLDTALEALDAAFDAGQFDRMRVEAEALLEQTPHVPDLWVRLARAHHRLGRIGDALQALAEAAKLNHLDADLRKTMGDLYLMMGDFESAVAQYRQALALRHDHAQTWNNLGVAQIRLRRFGPALESFRQVLRLHPDDPATLNNIAVVHHDSGNHAACIEHARRALAVDPDHAPAWNNLGNAYLGLRQHREAAEAYGRFLQLRPNDLEVRSKRMLCLARVCEFDELDREKQTFLRIFEADPEPAAAPNPWPLLVLFDEPEVHRRAAALAGRAFHHRPALGPLPVRKRGAGEPMRVGYFSADFHNHPTTHLVVGLLEEHDPAAVELHCFSFGPDRDPEFRNRVKAAAHRFHDVRGLTDRQVAELARREGLDVAIDLNGHTSNKRTGIFAYRAAPVQVAFLGYPGTMGVEDIDYYIADRVVVPEESRRHFLEEVAYMPHCYQVNDRRRRAAEPGPSRAECGLPEGAFVFCCFNNPQKFTGEVFDIWMQLLREVDDSVLWLLAPDEEDGVEATLRARARAAGIAGERLIFARRVSPAEHLARHRHADLFLDTLPCNAHTTASDALWMGLPVVTRAGRSLPARVAASLLNTIGVPELITHTAEEYHDLALSLARDRERLASIAARIRAGRDASPLFDTPRFARDLEDLFRQMLDRAAREGAARPDSRTALDTV